MITTVIFDIGEVYLHLLAGSAKYVQQKMGTSVSETYFYEGLDPLMLGQNTENEYWEDMIKKNSWNISVEDLKELVRKNFKEVKGTRKIIENLRQKGYKLALLSNHVKEWVEYSELIFDYHKLFHYTFYSYQLSLIKPDKDIFLALLRKLQVKPQECLFIDDSIKNIEAAKELGMKTIQFISAKKLKKELKEFNINTS